MITLPPGYEQFAELSKSIFRFNYVLIKDRYVKARLLWHPNNFF
jgi:hypothetical protein